jgi:hypothetical protein
LPGRLGTTFVRQILLSARYGVRIGEVDLIELSERFVLRVGGDVQVVRALDRLSFTVAAKWLR